MKLLSQHTYEKKKIFLISLAISLTVITIQTVIILISNSGLFTYIVDDSYIHLALAENILKGHYGVNLSEYSSPSSSILWPFILAPFSGLAFGYWMPFIINTFSAIGTLYIFSHIIKSIFHSNTVIDSKINNIYLLLVILLMVVTNLIGSVFGGMEHPLQVFLTSNPLRKSCFVLYVIIFSLLARI
jgi:predicted membrane-bound spermidine synthase